MKPYWSDKQVTLYLGDCLEVLAGMDAASVDAIATDPPYGLEFMGREWDSFKPSGAKLRTREDGRTNPREGKSRVTVPESYTTGAGKRGKPGIGERATDWVSNQGWNGFRCRTCGHLSHGGSPCQCETPDFARADDRWNLYQEWCEAWARECFRVLKPGGHLLAFGGTRTYHRLVCGIEDAGFEIRDSMHWIYAQGFPKSLNVSKDVRFCQCDVGELADGNGDVLGMRDGVPDVPGMAEEGHFSDVLAPMQRKGARPGLGGSRAQGTCGADEPGSTEVRGGQSSLEGWRHAQAPEGELQGGPLRPLSAGVPADGASGRLHHGAPARNGAMDWPVPEPRRDGESQGPRSVEQRPVESGTVSDERGSQAGRGRPLCGRCGKPVVPRGIGTALKPSHEPIVVARKPLAGTVAANVLTHGTGALNIAGCRVEPTGESRQREGEPSQETRYTDNGGTDFAALPGVRGGDPAGRWPPNVLLGPEAAAELDRQSGSVASSGTYAKGSRSVGAKDGAASIPLDGLTAPQYTDAGGASRFFPVFRYEAKAASAERPRGDDGTAHPTVKPVDLMSWLVRLVTPPGGLVLDPFAGSGATAEACIVEGFRCVLVEKDPAYAELIRTRLRKPIQPVLFGDEAS